MNTTICLIDDHSILLDALRLLLGTRLPDAKIITATTLHQALLIETPPDVAILDLKLQGINGLEGIGLLKTKWPKIKVIILSSQDDASTQQTAIQRGAACFISKADSSDRIVWAIEQVIGDQDHLLAKTTPPLTIQGLTARQLEVLDLLCQGLCNKLIARKLNLSENTVRRHNQDIFAFLQVTSRTEAVFKAKRMGIIS